LALPEINPRRESVINYSSVEKIFLYQRTLKLVRSARVSGRQHKAWGASPRIRIIKKFWSPQSGWQRQRLQTVTRIRGLSILFIQLYLGLAPQALCFRPLSRAHLSGWRGAFINAKTRGGLGYRFKLFTNSTNRGSVRRFFNTGSTFINGSQLKRSVRDFSSQSSARWRSSIPA
jgi:hypothetical protein